MRQFTRTDWHMRIEETLRKIFNSLDTPLSFRELAEEVAASPYHFHRRFKELTGENIASFMRRLRLERAAYQLKLSGLSITGIAFEAGFQSGEAFSKAFKNFFGMSPSGARALSNWKEILKEAKGIHYQADVKNKNWFIIKTGGNEMDVKIINLPSKRLLCMRQKGDYWKLPELWQKFAKELEARKLMRNDSMFMIVFHDHWNDTPMEERRSDVAMTTEENVRIKGEISLSETPGGLYAVTTHVGSYEEIQNTWEKWKTQWLPVSEWELDKSRPSLEWYQNSPSQLPPELLVTFLCDPVKRK